MIKRLAICKHFTVKEDVHYLVCKIFQVSITQGDKTQRLINIHSSIIYQLLQISLHNQLSIEQKWYILKLTHYTFICVKLSIKILATRKNFWLSSIINIKPCYIKETGCKDGCFVDFIHLLKKLANRKKLYLCMNGNVITYIFKVQKLFFAGFCHYHLAIMSEHAYFYPLSGRKISL